jgi:RimJ/RimL family protein N-acetyltransferase
VIICETERLVLRELTLDDAPFILRLLNDPAWLEFIGDRGVRTVEAAREYLETRILKMYCDHGLGLWLVETKDEKTPAGICGLLKRDTLIDVDLGYAFLPEFRARGFAYEAGLASLVYGRTQLGVHRIVALTAPKNLRSIALLEKLGLRFEHTIAFPSTSDTSCLYAWETPAS